MQSTENEVADFLKYCIQRLGLTGTDAILSVGGWSPLTVWNSIQVMNEVSELEKNNDLKTLVPDSYLQLLGHIKKTCSEYLRDCPMHRLDLDFDGYFSARNITPLDTAIGNLEMVLEHIEALFQPKTTDSNFCDVVQAVELWAKENLHTLRQAKEQNFDSLQVSKLLTDIYVEDFKSKPTDTQITIWENLDSALEDYVRQLKSKPLKTPTEIGGTEGVEQFANYINEKLKNLNDISLNDATQKECKAREQECKEILLALLKGFTTF